MPVRGGDTTVESPLHTDTERSTKKRRRIPRACDRCRLKKSKCDGARVCKACQTTASTCLYRTRRNREAKNYYWYMRDITDEALVRLYRACRSGSGFPGHAIEEKDGQVTAQAILEGLGLTGPIEDDTANKDAQGSPTSATYPLQPLRRESPTPSLTPGESTTPANTSDNHSRTKPTETIDPNPTAESTRLQRQFQKQLQTPAMRTAPQPPPERLSMEASSYTYAYVLDHTREMYKTSAQLDAPRFDLSLAPRPTPSAPHTGDGLMASQFFDFETAGITPGMNVGTFDFPYSHDFWSRFRHDDRRPVGEAQLPFTWHCDGQAVREGLCGSWHGR